jgi:hypothetical protein
MIGARISRFLGDSFTNVSRSIRMENVASIVTSPTGVADEFCLFTQGWFFTERIAGATP